MRKKEGKKEGEERGKKERHSNEEVRRKGEEGGRRCYMDIMHL